MNNRENKYIPASVFFNCVMMFRPFYKKREKWACDDIVNLFQEKYEIDISKEEWFCSNTVDYLLRGCHDWNETKEKNYFSKYHKELNPFLGEKGDIDDWSSSRDIHSDGVHFHIIALSDYAIKILAQFIYPSFDENFTLEMVPQALQQRGIDVKGSKIDYEQILSTLKSIHHILNDPEAYIRKIEKEKEEKERRELDKIRLHKRRKNKFFTMLALAFVFYFISCLLYDFDDKEGAVCRVFIWFLWAAIEVTILSAWDVKSICPRIAKIYSIFSFLSVPLVASLFVFFLHAYNDRDFLRNTMILFAPAGYFLTWIIYLIHESAKSYINKNE